MNNQKKVDETWKEKAKQEAAQPPEQHPSGLPESDFKFFLSTLGMQAWIALGAIASPATDKKEENIPQAKFIIDTLGTLKEKTKGNLEKEEEDLLEHLLYELRLAYVHKTTPEDPEPKP